jgi:hypothetical protein
MPRLDLNFDGFQHAERTTAPVELAKLRGQSIHTLRDELGLKPISTAA